MKRLIAASFLLAAGLSAADRTVAPGLNRFADECYRDMARQPGNLVFSPASISVALSMALAGARGNTAAEIGAVLHQPAADAGYHGAVADLVAGLIKSAGPGNRLNFANGVWAQRGMAVLPDFQQLMQKVYGAPPGLADFAGDLDATRRAINSWCERQTEGKIRDLFAAGSLDRSTRMVLASAVYFNGKWQLAFRPADTQPAPFHPESAGPVQVPFMNRSGTFGYGETPEAQVLEMKYAGSDLAFDVVLPKPGTNLNKVEAAVADGQLTAWLAQIADRTVKVSLPKFRAESNILLNDTLTRLGMGGAFTPSADFSGIDDRRDLALSTVVHKAYVDVTEEGTEAAAATGIGVALVSMRVGEPVTFLADRPFLFAIRDRQNGAILFLGRLARPS